MQISLSGLCSTECLSVSPVYSSKVVHALYLTSEGPCFQRTKYLFEARCPRCYATDASMYHEQLLCRSSTQINMHQSVVHELSRKITLASIRLKGGSGCALNTVKDRRMGNMIERGGLRDGTAVPQAVGNMRARSADQDRLAASKSEARGRRHYARPGHVSSDEPNSKLATLPVEGVGHLGRYSRDLLHLGEASIVGGMDGSPWAKKGVRDKGLFNITSMTSQVAIPRRTQAFAKFKWRFERL